MSQEQSINQEERMDVTRMDNHESLDQRLLRLQDSSARGTGFQSNLQSNFQTNIGIEEASKAATIHTVVQPIIWNDQLLTVIPVYHTDAPADPAAWVEVYKAFHAYLTGMLPDEGLLWSLTTILEHSTIDHCPPKQPFGHKWLHFPSKQVKLVAPAGLTDRVTTHLQNLTGSDSAAESTTFKNNTVKIVINDKAFMEWYTMETINSQNFMFSQAIVLLKIFVRNAMNAYQHCQFRVWNQFGSFFTTPRPSKLYKSSDVIFNALDEYFRQQHAYQRGLMRCVLYTYSCLQLENPSRMLDAFKEYTLDLSFKYHAFHLVKIADQVMEDFNLKLTDLETVVKSEAKPDLIKEFGNLIYVRALMSKMQSNPKIDIPGGIKVTFHFWPYSRFFEGRCFLQAAVAKNTKLISYFGGLLKDTQKGILEITALKNSSNPDNLTYQSLGETRRMILKNLMPSPSVPAGIPPPVPIPPPSSGPVETLPRIQNIEDFDQYVR